MYQGFVTVYNSLGGDLDAVAEEISANGYSKEWVETARAAAPRDAEI